MIPALVLGGLNMAMGAARASQAANQRKAEAQMRAAEIEASPWTGKGPTTQISTAAPSVWSEMAGGAVNALGQTAALQNAGLFKASDVAATPALDANIGEDLGMGMQEAGKKSVEFFNKPLSESTWDRMVPGADSRMAMGAPSFGAPMKFSLGGGR